MSKDPNGAITRGVQGAKAALEAATPTVPDLSNVQLELPPLDEATAQRALGAATDAGAEAVRQTGEFLQTAEGQQASLAVINAAPYVLAASLAIWAIDKAVELTKEAAVALRPVASAGLVVLSVFLVLDFSAIAVVSSDSRLHSPLLRRAARAVASWHHPHPTPPHLTPPTTATHRPHAHPSHTYCRTRS